MKLMLFNNKHEIIIKLRRNVVDISQKNISLQVKLELTTVNFNRYRGDIEKINAKSADKWKEMAQIHSELTKKASIPTQKILKNKFFGGFLFPENSLTILAEYINISCWTLIFSEHVNLAIFNRLLREKDIVNSFQTWDQFHCCQIL